MRAALLYMLLDRSIYQDRSQLKRQQQTRS